MAVAALLPFQDTRPMLAMKILSFVFPCEHPLDLRHYNVQWKYAGSRHLAVQNGGCHCADCSMKVTLCVLQPGCQLTAERAMVPAISELNAVHIFPFSLAPASRSLPPFQAFSHFFPPSGGCDIADVHQVN